MSVFTSGTDACLRLRVLRCGLAALACWLPMAHAASNEGPLRHTTPDGQFGKMAVEVSARLPNRGGVTYGPANLVDHDPATAWVEGAPGDGIGQWVRLTFSGSMKFSTLLIYNGYCKNQDLLSKNNAPRKIRITTEAGSQTFELKRSLAQQTLRLRAPVDSRWVKLEILSVYPGTKYRDTAISEFGVDLEEWNYEPTGAGS